MKLPAVLGLAIALCAAPAFAGEPGNLMRMTTTAHMQMPGMPNMAPMTHTAQVCTSKAKPDPRQMMQRGQVCKVSNYQRIGNTVSYHVVCGGGMNMGGDGKFTQSADGGIHGTAHMAGGPDGHAMQMEMTIDGTRIGSCDYTPPAAH